MKQQAKIDLNTVGERKTQFTKAITQLAIAKAVKAEELNAQTIELKKLYFDCYELLNNFVGTTWINKYTNNKDLRQPSLPQTPLPNFECKFEFKGLFTDIMAKCLNKSDSTNLYWTRRRLVTRLVQLISRPSTTIITWVHESYWQNGAENMRTIVDIHVNGLLNMKSTTKASVC